MKTRTLAWLLILVMAVSATPAFAGEYQDNMQRDFVRGIKNMLTGWMEVPITIQEYHEGAGRPVIRHISGLVDGIFQAVVRTGSGGWDMLAGFIPGHQEGMPVKPETLF